VCDLFQVSVVENGDAIAQLQSFFLIVSDENSRTSPV